MSDAHRTAPPHDWIGQPVQRVDGGAKVDGSARYPQDLPVPEGCLHLATVRVPVASARITRIETTAATNLPGVVRVITAADVAGTNRFGLAEPDQPVLADGVVRGASDVVALVVGTDPTAARAGASAVDVSYEPGPLLLDPRRALADDAPVVHPDRPSVGHHPNLLCERAHRHGDVEKAMRDADIVVEGAYRTGRVEHAFLATEAGIASPAGDGGLVLHIATQWPEADLRQAATALGEPLEGLRIVQSTIGGAFGGREDISVQLLLLLAARVCDAPVRIALGRLESVRAHGKRHPFHIDYRLAADSDGRFTAAAVDLLIDAGCYASTSRQLLDNALSHAFGAYDIACTSARGRAVFTHQPFTCAFRGFGVNQMTFAVEQQVNRLAARLGLDPADVRRINLPKTRCDVRTDAYAPRPAGLLETLRAVDEVADEPLPAATGTLATGRGLACSLKNNGFGFGFADRATAEVSLVASEAGPSARVCVGAADVGQGVATVLTQIAATALDLPTDRVQVEWTDTAISPEAGSSSASRQTIAAGNAVLGACTRLRGQVGAGAQFRGPAAPSACCTWQFPETTPWGEPGPNLSVFSWSTCSADVEVDLRTGAVRVLQVAVAVDAGRVINPLLFRGQVEGGVVMGQGYALTERLPLRDGLPLAAGLEACAVPTALDAVPSIRTVAVEVPESVGPFGARGVGEITMIAVVPAITAAIHAACGVWIDELPATPDRVLAALEQRDTHAIRFSASRTARGRGVAG